MEEIKSYGNWVNTPLKSNEIFVFDSNPQGRHGAGAARFALQYCGAKWSQGKGLQGQSYAIITKDLRKSKHPSISDVQIRNQIMDLYNFAIKNPDKKFLVAYHADKPNLNGYTATEMAWMFLSHAIPNNVYFSNSFALLMTQLKNNLN